jgi:hypothetical protein
MSFIGGAVLALGRSTLKIVELHIRAGHPEPEALEFAGEVGFVSRRADLWCLFALPMTLGMGSAESSRRSPTERSPLSPTSAHKSIHALQTIFAGRSASFGKAWANQCDLSK